MEVNESDIAAGRQCKDVCDSSPCLNNGGCEPAENDNGFTCSCLLGYSGYTCQDYVCDSSPCLNNGECEPAENGFTCNCISGYSGDTCQDHICDSSPCQNGGICDPNFESPYYICSCVEGYHGSHCEIHVCDSSPCKNGGSCHAAGQSYRCDCLYGTEGEDCSVVMTTYCSFDDTCMLSNSPHVNCQWETRQGSSPTLYTGPRRAYSGQNYVYVDSTKYKGKRCQFEMREHFDDRQRCIILFYVMNGASVGALSVSKEVSGASSTLFTSSGNKGNMWRNQLIDVHTDSAANTTIRIEAMTKPAGQWGDIAIDEFQLRPYPCSDIVMCTFESGLPDESSVTTSCVKLHRGVDYYSNWRVRERPTQQNGPYPFIRTTGPLKSRSGYRYAFVDSSYNVDAVMEVRHTFTGEACLSFAYHMFGADIGTLFVFLDNVEIWSLSGEQGDEWHFVEIGIEFITNKKIIFTTDPGGYPGDSGDIALDDIMVVNRSCELV
ncbi:uncharacterized protein [Argopecten irradians]|uniref:uncharacterized protein n=1 Tax=Argopecten irradians TaxID=31199 RepID=UPI00371D7CD6